MENRRRAERLSTLCMGSCHVEDESSDVWWDCAIIDISTLGMGIELCHPDPVELLGLWQRGELQLQVSRRISVRLDLGPSVDVTVAGEVRNAGSGPNGIVRAGIEFVGLSEPESSMVDHLVREVSVSRLEPLGPQATNTVPVPGLGELPENVVQALGGHQTMTNPAPACSEIPKSFDEALGRQRIAEALRHAQTIHDPVSGEGELPRSPVEALGPHQTSADPDPVFSEGPESFDDALGGQTIAEALGRQQTIPDRVPGEYELPESIVEGLRPHQTIADPDPVFSELPESFDEALGRQRIVEALSRQQTISDPASGVSELPERPVDALGQAQTIHDPVPGFSELARMGSELAFLTLRVIGSDVIDLVNRFPAGPRILSAARWPARLGFGESNQTAFGGKVSDSE